MNGPVMPENADFDREAAWLRRFTADAEGHLRAFALQLKEALPDRVTLRHSKSFFAQKSKITGVSVELGQHLYGLEIEGGRLRATIALVVRGIALNTRHVEPAQWFVQLCEETKTASAHARALSQSLDSFMAR